MRTERVIGQDGLLIDNLWITKKQLAFKLGVSVGFINKWMPRGLPHRHFKGAVRFRVMDVLAWLERNSPR